MDYDIEHSCPDYALYGITDTAYGFLTRGCPRGCDFCVVGKKEGRKSRKVANLSEFWDGQRNIEILDPNLIACKDWEDLIGQIAETGSYVNFNQGLDIRIMTDEKAEALKKVKLSNVHFAWDKYEDKDKILPKFKMFKEITGWNERKMGVYVLTNFNTTIEQDLERIYTLRDIGFSPYVMIYNKNETRPADAVRRMQRWCNNRVIFKSCERFEDYIP